MSLDIDKIPLFNGIGGLLSGLSNGGVEIGIVSSNARKNISAVLGPANTSKVTYFACGASLFGKQAKLQKVIVASGFKTQQILYIADEVRDVEVAAQLDLPFRGVAWGYNHPEALQAINGTQVFYNVSDIEKVVLNDTP